MNRRLIAVFAFALLVAGGTSFLLYRVIVSHVQSPVHETVAQSTLIVAAHDLQVGALIHDSDVKQVSWRGSIPAQVIQKTTDGKPETAQVVNLLVTPDQAETLNLASIETKVQLVLRNPLDTKEEITPGTSIARLFGYVGDRPALLASPLRSPARRALSA